MNSYALNEAMGTADNMLQGCLMFGETLLKLKKWLQGEIKQKNHLLVATEEQK